MFENVATPSELLRAYQPTPGEVEDLEELQRKLPELLSKNALEELMHYSVDPMHPHWPRSISRLTPYSAWVVFMVRKHLGARGWEVSISNPYYMDADRNPSRPRYFLMFRPMFTLIPEKLT